MTESTKSRAINKQHFEPDFNNMQMPAPGEIPLVLQGDPQAQYYNTGNNDMYAQASQQQYIPEPEVEQDTDYDSAVIENEMAAEGVYEQQVEEAEEQPKPKHTSKEKEDNVRYFREALERSERERIKAEQQREEYAKMLFAQKNPVAPLDSIKSAPEIEEQVDIDIDGDDDSLSEKKDAKKIVKGFKAADKKYSKQFQSQSSEIQDLKKQLEQMRVDTFVRSKYSDFDSVVSPENIKKFNEMHPELAQTIHDTKDYYSKNVAAYSMFKQYGIAGNPVQQQATNAILDNIGKPKAGVAATPQKRMSPFDNMGRFDRNSEVTRMNLIRSMRDAQKNR